MGGHDLFLAMFAQEFAQSRLCHGEMISVQAFPNFFIVAERAGIVATGFMTHQVALWFFPTAC